jgi:hypothetical protein
MWDKILNWLGFRWVRNRDDKGRLKKPKVKTKPGKENTGVKNDFRLDLRCNYFSFTNN